MTRYALAAERVARFRQAPMRRRSAVRGRRGGLLRLRPRAHGGAARRPPNPDPLGLPDMALMLSDALVIFDHSSTQSRSWPTPTSSASPTSSARTTPPRHDRRDRARARGPRAARRASGTLAQREMPEFRSNMSRAQFEGMVERIVRYIHAGDAFQVVPSQRWSAPCRSRRSRSTAACAPSTPALTCTSWTSATSRSPAPARSRC